MTFIPPERAEQTFAKGTWLFGTCEFDEVSFELRVQGKVVDLERKPLEVLHQLLLRAGEAVRKEELLDSVWQGLSVVDASLATAVSKLRKALGEEEIIQTVPKLGYRIAVPVQFNPAQFNTSRSVSARNDLTRLQAAAIELEAPPSVSEPPKPVTSRPFFKRPILWWAFSAVLLISLLVGVTGLRPAPKPASTSGPIAILPFRNVSSNASLDFLQSALPDQVANALSPAQSLTIRPLAASNRYTGASVDLRAASHDLDVTRIVTGNYVLAGDQLQINMEVVDTGDNRILWHDTVNVPANNMLALQTQIAAISSKRLASALGVSGSIAEVAPPATNEEAYELYLKSVAMPYDPEPNKQATAMLRRAVLLDPNYAPAWGNLSLRYYNLSRFGGGGPEMLQFSDAAAERELALDPDLQFPVAQMALHRTERGELVKAHQTALELIKRRPDDPNNHHVLSYVLRYGGSLNEAGHECDMVVLLAAKITWGSCATTFMELGQYHHALDFVRKDLSSEWSKALALEIHLREAKTEPAEMQEALRIPAPKIPHWDSYKMLLACARLAPASEIKTIAAGVERDDDPEINYFFAGHLAYCGQTAAALRMLKTAISRNYCSYPAVDKDPFFDSLRNNPEFGRIRAAGMACHDNFVANRETAPTALPKAAESAAGKSFAVNTPAAPIPATSAVQ